MEELNQYEVIIIGGSYAGLSAAMTLGRSLRTVLVLDGGIPCNRYAPQAHNLIGFDGETPAAIAEKAREQVLKYHTVTFMSAKAEAISGRTNDFEVVTDSGLKLGAKKILLATGVTDVFPDIPGFEACWGKSAIHCPYCHGYEVAGKRIGILAHGEAGLEMTKLIRQWSKELVVLTNGNEAFSPDGQKILDELNIPVLDNEISEIIHSDGNVTKVVFADGSESALEALYVRAGVMQQTEILLHMGCEFDSHGFTVVDECKRTNVPGLFAAGDNTTVMRALSVAIAAGTLAGVSINKELVDENYS
jgi:thioredoxin reductase